MLHRPRRLRKNPIIRELVAETRLSKDMFIYPMFVAKGISGKREIKAMPGIHHFSVDELSKEVEALLKMGINKILLFGIGDEKTADGKSAADFNGIIPTAVRRLKADFASDLYLITDVCVCAYTNHGHCGVLANDHVLNDESVEVISQMALTHAEAGADMVAPSDMMDGRVLAIREILDSEGLDETAIMSYAAKFSSAYYGPFREAADSAPGKGDRKGYQMDFRNTRESIKEILLDEEEGADMVMVKPALAYLDIIKSARESTLLPLACYNVSGEYSMIRNAAASGLIDEQQIVMENMYAFTRAGADIIISYHTKDVMLKGWI